MNDSQKATGNLPYLLDFPYHTHRVTHVTEVRMPRE